MNKIKWLLAAVLVILALMAVCGNMMQRLRLQRSTIARLEGNIETLTESVMSRTIRDSLRVAEVRNLTLTTKELREQHTNDAQLIRDLRLRLRDTRSIETTTAIYRDTVYMQSEPSAAMGDTDALIFRDHWVNLVFHQRDSSLAYTFRDSISIVNHVTYKRHFLWWRWRPERHTTAVSHNPNCVSLDVNAVEVEE